MAKKLVVFDEEERYLYDVSGALEDAGVTLIDDTDAIDPTTTMALVNTVRDAVNEVLALMGAKAAPGGGD